MNPALSLNNSADIRKCGIVSDDRRESRAKPRDEAFAKKDRLIKTKDFRRVYKAGGSFSATKIGGSAFGGKTGAFVLKILPNALPVNRIGFSISSRSVKKAFRRNRIRRLFREAYRKNKKGLKKGFDMVLLARRDPGEKFCYENAKQIFLELAKKAGALS